MMFGRARNVIGVTLAVAAFSVSSIAAAQAVNAEARGAFIDKMVGSHGFDRDAVSKLIGGAVIDQKILDTMSRPAERVVPWFEYRNIFMTEARIAAGVKFWGEHA